MLIDAYRASDIVNSYLRKKIFLEQFHSIPNTKTGLTLKEYRETIYYFYSVLNKKYKAFCFIVGWLVKISTLVY